MTGDSSSAPIFDADGALTREFLLARGHCCESGCRNCPYGFRKDDGHSLRLVSLCPSNTEIVDALGLGKHLVGVDDWSDWPERLVADLPRLGPDLDIDLDAVETLVPDLVLASLSVPGMERNVEGLERRGIPHLVLDPHSLEDIYQDLKRVGRAAGCEEHARQVESHLRDRVAAVQAAVRGDESRPRLYWEWWPKPLFCPGRRNWLTEISELAGAVNVTAHYPDDAARPEPEEILELQPDFVLLVWTGVQKEKVRPDVVSRRPGWGELTALREGRLHVLAEGLYCRPSPRLIEGLEELARLVHPECFRRLT
ncbi:MAG: helical backbone metal receptor [Planctomycetota bacterium]